jgi:hypothetical protein
MAAQPQKAGARGMKKAPALRTCPQEGHNRTPGQQIGGWAERTCPECGKRFEPNRRNQLFCSAPHKAAWENRATVRGKVLTPIAAVARMTRNGTRGSDEDRVIARKASNAQNRLIQQWRDEDREAGRMGATEFLRARVRFGMFDLI